MRNREPMYKYALLNYKDGTRYLGNRDQIEELLGFCNMTEVRERTREPESLQPQEQINSVLEDRK